MSLICFDLDGVLADFNKGFLEFLNNKLGTDYKKLENGVTHTEYDTNFMDFLYSGGYGKLLLMRQHYENTLFRLLQDGYSICYITSRPIEARNDTVQWLARHGLPIGIIEFTHAKAAAAIALGVDVMVEDNVNQIRAIKDVGIPCVMISREYNLGISIPEVPRVSTSQQLYNTITSFI